MPRSSDACIGSSVTKGSAVRRRIEKGARPVELGGSETSESGVPGVPSTLEEAYGLRDASATSEGRDYYQEHVYRLRGEEYRSRGIRFDE